jgi:hypothetical protein
VIDFCALTPRRGARFTTQTRLETPGDLDHIS